MKKIIFIVFFAANFCGAQEDKSLRDNLLVLQSSLEALKNYFEKIAKKSEVADVPKPIETPVSPPPSVDEPKPIVEEPIVPPPAPTDQPAPIEEVQEDINKNKEYQAILKKKNQVEALVLADLQILLTNIESLEKNVSLGQFIEKELPQEIKELKGNLVKKIEERKKEEEAKKQRQKDAYDLYTTIKTQNPIPDLNKALDLNNWFNTIKNYLKSNNFSLQDFIVNNEFYFNTKPGGYAQAKKEVISYIDFLKAVKLSIENWFNKENLYKGKDIPQYKEIFTKDDYALYSLSSRMIESLAKSFGITISVDKNVAENSKVFGMWVGLPSTPSVYSPLEESIVETVRQELDSYRPKSNLTEQEQKAFYQKLLELKAIAFRAGQFGELTYFRQLYKDSIKNIDSLKNTYPDISGELNVLEQKKSYEEEQKGKVEQAQRDYEVALKAYEANKNPEALSLLQEKIKKLVAVKAPSEDILELYSTGKIQEKKEKPSSELKAPEEEERDEEKKEQLEIELEKIKNISDFSSYSRDQIEDLLKKIAEYRHLSEKDQAYLKAFTHLSQELKTK